MLMFFKDEVFNMIYQTKLMKFGSINYQMTIQTNYRITGYTWTLEFTPHYLTVVEFYRSLHGKGEN